MTVVSTNDDICEVSVQKYKSLRRKTDHPYAIMVEDDCNHDLVRFWNYLEGLFYGRIPYDWDVIPNLIICTGDIHIKINGS